MARGKMVEWICNEQVFNRQSIWKLNNERYFELRENMYNVIGSGTVLDSMFIFAESK